VKRRKGEALISPRMEITNTPPHHVKPYGG